MTEKKEVSVTRNIDQKEVVQLLLRLRDLKSLGNIALLELAQSAQFMEIHTGQLLSAEQQQNRHLYLLEGKIELAADGKNRQIIEADSERALMPLFRLHSHGLLARCLSPVQLLSLNEELVNRYVATIRPIEPGIQVKELSGQSEELSLLVEVRQLFNQAEVDLPSLPDVALRVNAAINEPNQALQKLAREIQTDPMITARVIQVANSTLYATARPVDTLQEAVSRVGLKTLQTIVMSVVSRDLFKPKSHLILQRIRKFYLHSIRVGAISHSLARHLPDFSPEHALLAGLLHDIGTMPILILADRRRDLSVNAEMLEAVITNLSGMVGGLLLRQWGFSPDLVTTAQQAQEWQRQVAKADYCDLIQIAQLHCHLVGGPKLDAPALNKVPAFSRLQLEKIDPVTIVQQAREEIHEVVNLLTH